MRKNLDLKDHQHRVNLFQRQHKKKYGRKLHRKIPMKGLGLETNDDLDPNTVKKSISTNISHLNIEAEVSHLLEGEDPDHEGIKKTIEIDRETASTIETKNINQRIITGKKLWKWRCLQFQPKFPCHPYPENNVVKGSVHVPP